MILYLVILVLQTSSQQLFVGKASAYCNSVSTQFYFNYTVATYGPSSQEIQVELLYFIDNQYLCNQDISDLDRESLKKGSRKKAILAMRGSCKFAEKTKNIQALGAHLAVIYDDQNQYFIVPHALEKDYSININTVFLMRQDLKQMDQYFSPNCQGKAHLHFLNVNNQQMIEVKPIQLPQVHLNIQDLDEMEYLSQFYRHPLYDQFIDHIRLDHKIIYKQKSCESMSYCNSSADCLLDQPLSSGNYLCYSGIPLNNGRNMIRIQIISYSILQVLGNNLWFMFRQLFYHNLCHLDPSKYDECIGDTLTQLKINDNQKAQIEQKTQFFSKRQNLQSFDKSIKLIKETKYTNNIYADKMNNTLSNLCSKIQVNLKTCNRLQNLPQKINVVSHQPIYQQYQFNYNQTLHLELDQNISSNTKELLIILSSRSTAFHSISNYNFTLPASYSSSGLKIEGRYGFYSDYSENDLQISSTHTVENDCFLVLTNKQILTNNLTIYLKYLTKSYLMIHAIPKNYILRPNIDALIITQTSKNNSIIIQTNYVEQENSYQTLFIESKDIRNDISYGYKKIQVFNEYDWLNGNQNNIISDLFEMDNRYTSQNINFFKLTFKKIPYSLKKPAGCSMDINQNQMISYKCRIVITITQKSTSPSIVKFYILKYNRVNIFPLNSFISPVISYKYPVVQKLLITEKDFPSQEITFFIINTTTKTTNPQKSKQFRHEYRALKAGQKDFVTIEDWKENYKKRTDLLYHIQEVREEGYSSLLQIGHPYNAPKQFMKVRNMTIYLVYKYDEDDGLSARISQIIEYNLDKRPRTNKQTLKSIQSFYNFLEPTGAQQLLFSIQDNMTNAYSEFILNLQTPSRAKNLRVFSRITAKVSSVYYLPNYYSTQLGYQPSIYRYLKSSSFQAFSHALNITQSDSLVHDHPKSYEMRMTLSPLIRTLEQEIQSHYNLKYSSKSRSILVIQARIYIEMIDKSQLIEEKQSYYMLGNSLTNIPAFKEGYPLNPLQQIYFIANPLVSYQNYIQFKTYKLIRLVNIQCLYPLLTEKAQLCAYTKTQLSQCYAYNNQTVKSYKNLQTDEIFTGLKVKQSEVKFTIVFAQNDVLQPNESKDISMLYYEYSKLDIGVKLVFKDFSKLVEVTKIDDYKNGAFNNNSISYKSNLIRIFQETTQPNISIDDDMEKLIEDILNKTFTQIKEKQEKNQSQIVKNQTKVQQKKQQETKQEPKQQPNIIEQKKQEIHQQPSKIEVKKQKSKQLQQKQSDKKQSKQAQQPKQKIEKQSVQNKSGNQQQKEKPEQKQETTQQHIQQSTDSEKLQKQGKKQELNQKVKQQQTNQPHQQSKETIKKQQISGDKSQTEVKNLNQNSSSMTTNKTGPHTSKQIQQLSANSLKPILTDSSDKPKVQSPNHQQQSSVESLSMISDQLQILIFLILLVLIVLLLLISLMFKFMKSQQKQIKNSSEIEVDYNESENKMAQSITD